MDWAVWRGGEGAAAHEGDKHSAAASSKGAARCTSVPGMAAAHEDGRNAQLGRALVTPNAIKLD